MGRGSSLAVVGGSEFIKSDTLLNAEECCVSISGEMTRAVELQVKGSELTVVRNHTAYPGKWCKKGDAALQLLAKGEKVVVAGGDVHNVRALWQEATGVQD